MFASTRTISGKTRRSAWALDVANLIEMNSFATQMSEMLPVSDQTQQVN